MTENPKIVIPNSNEYFSIDSILASQERVPCTFNLPVHRLGFLDPSCATEDLVPGTKLDLPNWLAKSLHTRKRNIVNMEIPKQYRDGYREIFKADPNVVDLHKLGPHYYEFGTHLLGYQHPESQDIALSLLKTFQERFRQIMDSSQNAYYEDTNQLMAKLDEMEKRLFRSGQLCLSDFQRWESRKTEKMTTSDMVSRHRKRKRAEFESI